MSRTAINVGAVIEASSQIKLAKTSVSNAKSSFTQTKNSIDEKIKKRYNIRARLNSVQSRMSAIETRVGKIQSTVESGANLYVRTDAKIEGWREDIRHDVGGQTGTQINSKWATFFEESPEAGKIEHKSVAETVSEKKSLWDWGDTWNAISELGPIGAGVSMIGQFFTGGTQCNNLLDLAKSAAGLTEDIAKGISNNTTFDWKTLLGFTAIEKKSFTNAFQSAIDDYDFSKAANTSGTVAVVAKWAGLSLTVATTAYDNFYEEDNSALRSLAETVGESAIKIVGGVACKAAVTTIAGAVGGPVIATTAAVGLVAVGVTWAADAICEAWCGKGAVEAVSDFALDTIESIGSAVGSAAKKAAGAVSGWWNSIWD